MIPTSSPKQPLTSTGTPHFSRNKGRHDLWEPVGLDLWCLVSQSPDLCRWKGSWSCALRSRDLERDCVFIIKAPVGFIPSCAPTIFSQTDLWLADIEDIATLAQSGDTLVLTRTAEPRAAPSDKVPPCRVNSASALFNPLCVKSCLLLMTFLPDYVELQEWGNILDEKEI